MISRRWPARVIVLAGIAAVCLAAPTLEAQTWRTMTSSRQVWDREPLDVHIQYGAGTLTVKPAEATTLYHMELRYDEDSTEPRAEFNAERRTLRLGVVNSGSSGRSMGRRGASTAEIALSQEVPLDLDLDFGAGSAQIELGGMALQRLAVSTGASETRISFSSPNATVAERVDIEAGAADLQVIGLGNVRAQHVNFQGGVGSTVLDFSGGWSGDVSASVQIGIGSMTLRLPRGPGIRIRRNAFLSSFSAPGMERQGDSYYTANWADASTRLTIDVSAALGSIDIQWID